MVRDSSGARGTNEMSDEGKMNRGSFVGTPLYVPPEML